MNDVNRKDRIRTLGNFIANRVPKFNELMVNGICYYRIKNALRYMDDFIRYSCIGKTKTNLSYIGYDIMTPMEEFKMLTSKTAKAIHDISRNDIYPIKYMFRYGEEEVVREYYFYLPFLSKGNVMYISGKPIMISPILSDKVISIGNKIIFVNILTAKYSFTRTYFAVKVDIGGMRDNMVRVPIISTELYKNQSKKLAITTKAFTTLMHYMLANHGYTETMMSVLGFVPTPVYDYTGDDKVVISPTGKPPHGYIRSSLIYKPSNIKFVVDKDKYNENVLYCIGNIFYILDNFSGVVSIDMLDDVLSWRRLLGEIILSGNHGIAYLTDKMDAHFKDINSPFDARTISKLLDINVTSSTLMELISVIFKNYNTWIMSDSNKSLYYNKTFEAESTILGSLTSKITRIVLDITKEEIRTIGPLDKSVVDKTFKKYFSIRTIFGIRKNKQIISSTEYSGDSLYYKGTAIIVPQQADYTSMSRLDSITTAERNKIIASVATVGTILGVPKKDPNPLVRLNPYVEIDYTTGTVLPSKYNQIVDETDILLAYVDSNEKMEPDEMLAEAAADLEAELGEDSSSSGWDEGENFEQEEAD